MSTIVDMRISRNHLLKIVNKFSYIRSSVQYSIFVFKNFIVSAIRYTCPTLVEKNWKLSRLPLTLLLMHEVHFVYQSFLVYRSILSIELSQFHFQNEKFNFSPPVSTGKLHQFYWFGSTLICVIYPFFSWLKSIPSLVDADHKNW